jgi:hypothetical protein
VYCEGIILTTSDVISTQDYTMMGKNSRGIIFSEMALLPCEIETV